MARQSSAKACTAVRIRSRPQLILVSPCKQIVCEDLFVLWDRYWDSKTDFNALRNLKRHQHVCCDLLSKCIFDIGQHNTHCSTKMRLSL